MTDFAPGDYIRERHGHQPSVGDQVTLAGFIYRHGITPAGTERTRREIEEMLDAQDVELEHNLKTVLRNLVKIDIVDEFYPRPGARSFPISERLDDVVFDNYEEVIRTDQERFIAYMQAADGADPSESPAVADGGVTVRVVVSDALDCAPGNVEAEMLDGDLNEQRGKLETAIDAVDSHPGVENGDDYGRVFWRNMGYRYQITEWAINQFT